MPLFGGDGRRGRTAEEREAARLERERRRARREGRPEPQPPARRTTAEQPPPAVEPEPVVDEPPPEPVVEAPPEPVVEAPPEPVVEAPPEPVVEAPPEPVVEAPPEPVVEAPPEPVAEAPPEPVVEAPPEPEPEPIEPHPDPEPVPPGPSREPAPEPAAVAAAAPAESGTASQPTEPFDVVPQDGRRTVRLPRPQGPEEDRPIGTMRISRAEYQAQPGAIGMPPHRKIGVPRRRGRFARRLVPLLLLLAFAAVGAFAVLLFQPFHGDGSGATVVRIAPGAETKEIGDQLADRGVVSSGFFFALRARLRGDRDKLRSGTYTLQKNMTYAAALDALTTAPKAAAVMDVTLPEGPGRRELAPRVRAAGIRGSYLAASRGSATLNPRAFGAPRGTASLEGFLFPSSYELKRSDATAERLVAEQLRAFKARFAKVDLRRARRRNLSRYDVVVIASMIEREALVPRDRRLISAVIYNRLSKNIPLGIDATLRYRLNTWSRPLRRSELERTGRYNTRTRTGLPPTPIGNPGLASLRAAADPAKVALPVLRRQAVRQRRPRVLLDVRGVPARRRRLRPRSRPAGRQGPLALLTISEARTA